MSVKDCIAQQYRIYELICIAVSNLKKSGKTNLSKNVLNVHLENLEKKWSKFGTNHDQLLIVREDNSTDPYFAQDLFTKGEEKYVAAKVYMQDELDALAAFSSSKGTTPVTKDAPLTQVKKMFPQLELPKFSGDFTAWPAFRDMFCSMVKDEAALPSIQKLHYLKASLTDEPAQLLVNISVTGDNLERAWTTLMDRYDSGRALINAYLGKLFGIEPVTKEHVSGLRTLLNDTCEVIGGLTSTNRPTKYWDDILVYMTVNRLDRSSRKAWEEKTGSLPTNPSFETLRTFLVHE